jgi:hypothetical protein
MTQNASHTAETRWEYRLNDGIGAYDVYAVTTTPNGTPSEYKVASDLPIEDAHLIAAAPELLQWLIAAEGMLTQCMQQADFTLGACKNMTAIRVAIAKAESR